MWSGKASSVRRSKTFAERHEQASAAVSEAAKRTEMFLTNELAADKPPREAAEAQRRWLTVLDRHEAANRRRCVLTGGKSWKRSCKRASRKITVNSKSGDVRRHWLVFMMTTLTGTNMAVTTRDRGDVRQRFREGRGVRGRVRRTAWLVVANLIQLACCETSSLCASRLLCVGPSCLIFFVRMHRVHLVFWSIVRLFFFREKNMKMISLNSVRINIVHVCILSRSDWLVD